ncbi:MAG: polymer-forming cytoskeletal protein [Rhodospirillum sp.]|nr:polymer-forming cytoskeletal protein [Rhodospirillum sp.]MCF8488162.1 polymer-forming cytoskeletal protein [Rhodospirillum sp.]MCF8499462.1 polymer-forming cytoskeletal protein [Rhodospirillum sp.]
MSRATQGTQSKMHQSDTTQAQPSYLAPDLVIRGRVSSGAELFVAGRIEGEVDCATVSVTKGGTIDGFIRAQRVNLEPGSNVTGEIRVETMGVKGDARVHARIICQGSQRREPARDMSTRSGKARDTMSSLAQPIPAE